MHVIKCSLIQYGTHSNGCCRARRDRDLQNIWDDLLSRHTLETHVLESLSSWLSPAVRVEKEE